MEIWMGLCGSHCDNHGSIQLVYSHDNSLAVRTIPREKQGPNADILERNSEKRLMLPTTKVQR